ncbi:chemotaxis protein [Bacillus massilinigeriensis]|uniref:chemotaxis protein n=1 Tax=Bacillus mediterraneensis TaxID=1805474 RepID=UPI0008F8AF89|nr:chemotaxis protein [Bacillus mediterraneensis]
METSKGILLESGTNELEIVEFGVGQNRFAINVMKVREIINPCQVIALPHTHRFVEGIIELRGEVLPVINVAEALGFPASADPEKDKFIVAEFNQQKTVFHVHQVTQIHRISWEDIEKPSDLYNGLETQVIGVIQLGDHMVLFLDFEKILYDINPDSGMKANGVKKLGERERSDKRIVIAEDSAMLRTLLRETLNHAGYSNLEFFENGQEAYEYLESVGNDIEKVPDLLITDLEMPQMDGHHLTKRIKEHAELSSLPVVIFSSLITLDLMHKGNIVGAQAQISKPEIGKLVEKIDELLLNL